MRVLLRNVETGAFFRTASDWTEDPLKALNFDHRDVAANVARELGLQNMEVLVASEDGTPIFGTRLKIDP